jgi:SAM-dependent methyltransferase
MPQRTYGAGFLETIGEGPRRSARRVVPLVLELTDPRSVIDIGCGNGDWLATFAELGVTDLLGVEGPGSDPSLASIPRSQLLIHDLTEPLHLERGFDLAVCLEVGEHLAAEAAPGLVTSLVGLSAIVLFSAAIPGQGGHHHVNEQWPDYWEALFAEHGYVAVDCIRGAIWDDMGVDVWYRQNTLLYVAADRLASLPALVATTTGAMPRRVVHPELVTSWPPRVILRILAPAVRRSVAARVSRLTVRVSAGRPGVPSGRRP